jgi:hypothetical protein
VWRIVGKAFDAFLNPNEAMSLGLALSYSCNTGLGQQSTGGRVPNTGTTDVRPRDVPGTDCASDVLLNRIVNTFGSCQDLERGAIMTTFELSIKQVEFSMAVKDYKCVTAPLRVKGDLVANCVKIGANGCRIQKRVTARSPRRCACFYTAPLATCKSEGSPLVWSNAT